MLRLAVVVVALLAPTLPSRAAAPPSEAASRAERLLQNGDTAGAQRVAEPLVAGTAPDPLALVVLGRVARRQGRTDDAVRLLEAAVAADPRSSDAHVHLGGAYVDKLRAVGILRRLAWARKLRGVVQTAVDLDPESCEARRALAEFYLEAPKIAGGSPERARSEAAAFRDRCQARGHLAFAVAAQTTRDLPAAEEACLQALVAAPGEAEGWALLGWLEREQGVARDAPPPAAIRDLFAAAAPWHRALHEAGRSGALPGQDVEAAESALGAVLKKEKDPARRARALWALGLAHQIRGDGDAAWREYTAALELDPSLDLAVRGRESLRPGSPEIPPPGEEGTTAD